MAIFQKETRNTLLGVGIGAGAVLAVRFVAPVVIAVARPLTKALIIHSMEAFEKLARKAAGAAESFQDLVAEARADRSLAASPVVAEAPGHAREVN